MKSGNEERLAKLATTEQRAGQIWIWGAHSTVQIKKKKKKASLLLTYRQKPGILAPTCKADNLQPGNALLIRSVLAFYRWKKLRCVALPPVRDGGVREGWEGAPARF